MTRPTVELDLGFKKMTIEAAIQLLLEEKARGATHVAGLHVQWVKHS